jgi:hypothetical protein
VAVPPVTVAVKVEEPPLHTAVGLAVRLLTVGKEFTVTVVADEEVAVQPLLLRTVTE